MVFFIDHAVDRMRERGFTVDDVKSVLFDGEFDISTVQKQGGFLRHARKKMLRGKLARVFYIELHDRYDILTVLWARD
jgi:hypothetical protein